MPSNRQLADLRFALLMTPDIPPTMPELGGVLFISLEATVVGHPPQQQMDWLRQLLAEHGPAYLRRTAFYDTLLRITIVTTWRFPLPFSLSCLRNPFHC